MLPSQRHLFEIPRDVAYLNNASYTPLPRSVRQAGEAGAAAKSQPWLMDHDAIAQTVEAVREAAAGFIGATVDDIAIVHSAAYGIATAAANVPITRDTRILLVEGEFPSQALEWARRAAETGAMLDVVPRPADDDWTAALLARIAQPGLPPVGIAALTPLHWTDGTLIDLERLAPALRAQGAVSVVDATQAVGILPVDVGRIAADYMVFPTYKWLLGPYTLAFLYVAPARQGGTPLEQYGANRIGGAEAFTGRLGDPIATARRFDMGQRNNPVNLPMALAGMQLLRSWNRDAVVARLRSLTDCLAAAAAACGFQPVPSSLRSPHIVGLRTPAGLDTATVVASLARQGVHVADRGGIRIGAHVFNDEGDIARFTTALHHAARG